MLLVNEEIEKLLGIAGLHRQWCCHLELDILVDHEFSRAVGYFLGRVGI